MTLEGWLKELSFTPFANKNYRVAIAKDVRSFPYSKTRSLKSNPI